MISHLVLMSFETAGKVIFFPPLPPLRQYEKNPFFSARQSKLQRREEDQSRPQCVREKEELGGDFHRMPSSQQPYAKKGLDLSWRFPCPRSENWVPPVRKKWGGGQESGHMTILYRAAHILEMPGRKRGDGRWTGMEKKRARR